MKPSQILTPWGLELYACRTDAFKTHSLSMCLTFDPDPVRSPMRTLLCQVLHRGTETWQTQDALNRYLDELYDADLPVRSQRRAEMQVLSLGLGVLDASFLPGREVLLPKALRVLEEIWRRPLLDGEGLLREDFVEGERKILLDEISADAASPRYLAARSCRDLMYPGEPASVRPSGTGEAVAAMDRRTLTDLWRETVLAAHPIFFYVGSEEPEAVAEQIRAAFGTLPGGARTVLAFPPVPEPLAVPRAGETELSITQSILALGFETPVRQNSEDYHAFLVFNELFSQSPVSRLFTQVREARGLCYDIDARYNACRGSLIVTAGVRPDRVGEAEAAILGQAEELAAGHFSRSELAAAKRSLDSVYRRAFDDPDALEIYWFGRLLYGIDEDAETCRARIAGVSAADVVRAARSVSLRARFVVRGRRPAGSEETEK